MASPAVVGTPTESAETADVTTHNIARPAGVSGQLTIICFSFDGGSNVVITPASGYTLIPSSRVDNGTGHGSAAFYHQEDGTEGTNVDFTTDDLEKSCSVVYSISGAENPATQAPEASTFTTNTGTLNPDPPSLTPTGGSKDYLFLTGVGQNGEEADDDTWATAAPTNYTNLRQTTTGTTGVATTNTDLATAQRQLTAASDDPGTFTVAQSLGYVAFTIAIHPPGAAATSLIIPGGFPQALLVQ